jgi:hypothetical protein
MIERTVEAELARPAWEEREAIGPQDSTSLRWHADGLRARARLFEDDPHQMASVSIRWLRTIARCLDHGADAMDVTHG